VKRLPTNDLDERLQRTEITADPVLQEIAKMAFFNPKSDPWSLPFLRMLFGFLTPN